MIANQNQFYVSPEDYLAGERKIRLNMSIDKAKFMQW